MFPVLLLPIIAVIISKYPTSIHVSYFIFPQYFEFPIDPVFERL